MAGLAATRLFSAGGAGGIVLTYWALRKAGMPRKETASRMVAFLVLLYAVYMSTLLINGILLRTGVFDGARAAGADDRAGGDRRRRDPDLPGAGADPGRPRAALLLGVAGGVLGPRVRRLATVPATVAVGTREAIAFVRDPSRGGLAVLGAVGFWATHIGDPLGLVQRLRRGRAARRGRPGLLPRHGRQPDPARPGGVGAVDAGMIGAFVLFGVSHVFAAVLLYRVLAFWLPIPPGIVAFLQLRKTVHGWEQTAGTRTTPARTATGTATPTRHYFRK